MISILRFNPRYRPSLWTNIKWYAQAVYEYPRGVLCGVCHRPNFFFDDCGWFWIYAARGWPEAEGAIVCRKCWEGPLGEEHRKMYGLGER